MNLLRIRRRSQSILMGQNPSNDHVSVCAVHLWSIRAPFGSDYILCLWWALGLLVTFSLYVPNCFVSGGTQRTIHQSLLSLHAFFASTPPPFASSSHPHSSLSLPISTRSDRYLTMVKSYFSPPPSSFSKFNLVLNIPVALIRCPR